MADAPIYLDNHSTTQVDPRVVEAMLPTLTRHFGNPSSPNHAFGWEAEELVNVARERTAALIGAEPDEIVFTSGATESDNLAIAGAARTLEGRRGHIVTVATEHPAVLDPCAALARAGWDITVLPVDSEGLVTAERVAEALRDDTALLSVMAANNEIGTLQPIREIGAAARERGVLFHTDAVQAVGKVPLDVNADHIDLLSISGHKVHGPKGVGALFVRRRAPRVRLTPLVVGGGQERGIRSGTLNVTGAVGLGKAMEIAREEREGDTARARALRDRLLSALREGVDGLQVNGTLERRLPGNLNVSIPGVEGDALITALGGIALSTGSACATSKQEMSHVLQALGFPEERVKSSVRIGIGRFNTVGEIDETARRIAEQAARLRAASPRA